MPSTSYRQARTMAAAAHDPEFAKKTGYEVEVVTVPYQGYEAKYLAAFMGRSGAPDFFNGMTLSQLRDHVYAKASNPFPAPKPNAVEWFTGTPLYNLHSIPY